MALDYTGEAHISSFQPTAARWWNGDVLSRVAWELEWTLFVSHAQCRYTSARPPTQRYTARTRHKVVLIPWRHPDRTAATFSKGKIIECSEMEIVLYFALLTEDLQAHKLCLFSQSWKENQNHMNHPSNPRAQWQDGPSYCLSTCGLGFLILQIIGMVHLFCDSSFQPSPSSTVLFSAWVNSWGKSEMLAFYCQSEWAWIYQLCTGKQGSCSLKGLPCEVNLISSVSQSSTLEVCSIICGKCWSIPADTGRVKTASPSTKANNQDLHLFCEQPLFNLESRRVTFKPFRVSREFCYLCSSQYKWNHSKETMVLVDIDRKMGNKQHSVCACSSDLVGREDEDNLGIWYLFCSNCQEEWGHLVLV